MERKNFTDSELTKGEIERLEGNLEFLESGVTFSNREEYYERYGQIISTLRDSTFNTFNMSHTYGKELEWAVKAKTVEEFNDPIIQSYLPVIKSELLDIRDFIIEQKNRMK